eukprot:1175725-Prorocentrum_minimum.AAC.6
MAANWTNTAHRHTVTTQCPHGQQARQIAPNRGRGERICPQRAPIAEREREYTRSGHQSRKGRENIPAAGTNRGKGERICAIRFATCPLRPPHRPALL